MNIRSWYSLQIYKCTHTRTHTHLHNRPQIKSIVSCPKAYHCRNLHENFSRTFWVILLTDRHTETNADVFQWNSVSGRDPDAREYHEYSIDRLQQQQLSVSSDAPHQIHAVTSKVKGQGHKVRWCVWQVLADKSRTKRPRNTKSGRKVAYSTRNNVHHFPGQRSKVKVTNRLMLRQKVRQIFRTERSTNL